MMVKDLVNDLEKGDRTKEMLRVRPSSGFVPVDSMAQLQDLMIQRNAFTSLNTLSQQSGNFLGQNLGMARTLNGGFPQW